MKNINSLRYRFFILIIVLLASSFSCAEKHFVKTQIFIRDSPLLDISKIDLSDPLKNHEGFIFYPDGTFEAKVEIDNKVFEFSGNYGADDVGSGFHYSLYNVSPRKTSVEMVTTAGLWNCETNTEEDFFACIELRLNDEIITYTNIQ